MGLKGKILSSIAFMSLAIVLTFVGVWALTDLNFVVGGNITYTAPEPQPATITMGRYSGEGVEWQIVAVNGERYVGANLPSSGVGTFVLKSDLGIMCAWGEGEYSASDIRVYLNGEYLETLNLIDDEIYQAVVPRTMSDMYTDIGWNYGKNVSGYSENEIYSISTISQESDKLWLLSVAEVYTLICGGEIGSDGIVPSLWNIEIRENCAWENVDHGFWWLRSSIYDKESELLKTFCIYTGGGNRLDYSSNECIVRPAFNVDLSLL